MRSPNRKVTIFQYRLFHYRVALFERMRELASDADIDLHIVCGQPSQSENAKRDEGTLPWAEKVTNWYLPIKEKKDLCWQPTPPHLKNSRLIVVMQENRLLSNYPWLLKRRFGGPLVAYWGHGRDFQSNVPGGLRERWKNILINQVDWWFAYTDVTMNILHAAGFPVARTTCLNNAIDTQGLRHDAAQVTTDMLSAIRSACDLKPGAPMALFCGSLYPDKKLDLLVQACDIIHQQIPDFRLVVIGDGSSAAGLVAAFDSRPWARWVGVKRGIEKAAYFRLARLVLNPGLVGLHVLDAFALGLPMVTTRDAKHSPEIAYLKDGVNGLITDSAPSTYADAALRLLLDDQYYAALSADAEAAGLRYTVDNMAANFIDGMNRCLSACEGVAHQSCV